jgi:hypothetical protein
LSGADGSEIERLDEAGCRCASVTFDQLLPAPGQEGKDIVVLDPWAGGPRRGRRFIARAIAPGIGIMKVPARVPL